MRERERERERESETDNETTLEKHVHVRSHIINSEYARRHLNFGKLHLFDKRFLSATHRLLSIWSPPTELRNPKKGC